MKFTTLIALLGATSATRLTRWGYDKKNPHPGFQANWDGFEGNWNYDRVIPDNFQGAGSGDDQFMNSMLQNYAVEEATDDGYPTGRFYFSHLAAWTAAREVLETHLGLTGQAKED